MPKFLDLSRQRKAMSPVNTLKATGRNVVGAEDFRRTSKDIYQTPRWNALRAKVLRLLGGRCCRCNSDQRVACDHIQPIEHGGDPWAYADLQLLCHKCNLQNVNDYRRAKNNGQPLPNLDYRTAEQKLIMQQFASSASAQKLSRLSDRSADQRRAALLSWDGAV